MPTRHVDRTIVRLRSGLPPADTREDDPEQFETTDFTNTPTTLTFTGGGGGFASGELNGVEIIVIDSVTNVAQITIVLYNILDVLYLTDTLENYTWTKVRVFQNNTQANFSGAPVEGYGPLTVQFTDLSQSDYALTWAWTFGDGGTSTEQNPSHVYVAIDEYTVSLTVTDSFGYSSTYTRTDYISATGVIPEDGAFKYRVLGGAGSPRFLLCGDELCLNTTFEFDVDGWVGLPSGEGLLARFRDETTLYGDYVLKVTDNSVTDSYYARYRRTVTSTFARRYIASFWFRAVSATKIGLMLAVGGTAVATKEVTVVSGLPDEWQFAVLLSDTLVQDGTTLDLRVYPVAPSVGGASVAVIEIDDVLLREVEYVLDLPTPRIFAQKWAENREYEAVPETGNWRYNRKGWRYGARLDYPLLTRDEEVIRQRISEHGSRVIFYPHSDFTDWCVLVGWDDEEFLRSHPGDKWVGHKGEVSLVGVESLAYKPRAYDVA